MKCPYTTMKKHYSFLSNRDIKKKAKLLLTGERRRERPIIKQTKRAWEWHQNLKVFGGEGKFYFTRRMKKETGY